VVDHSIQDFFSCAWCRSTQRTAELFNQNISCVKNVEAVFFNNPTDAKPIELLQDSHQIVKASSDNIVHVSLGDQKIHTFFVLQALLNAFEEIFHSLLVSNKELFQLTLQHLEYHKILHILPIYQWFLEFLIHQLTG